MMALHQVLDRSKGTGATLIAIVIIPIMVSHRFPLVEIHN